MSGLDGLQPQEPLPQGPFRQTTRPASSRPGDFDVVDLSIYQLDAVKRRQEEEKQAFTDVMYKVTKHSPSMQATVRKLGVDLGGHLSREAIRKNLPTFQRAWQMREVENLDLKNSAPLLYKDLSNLEFAAVSYDIVKELSTFDRIAGDLKRDWMLNVRNKIGADAMASGAAMDGKEWAEIAAIEDEMRSLPSLDNYFTPALGFVGQQAETVASSGAHVVAGAAIGAAGTPLGAAAGAAWGLRVGYAVNSYNVNSGGSYISMRRAGVSHQTARNYARGIGVGSTVLEMAGARMLTGVSPKKVKAALKRIAGNGGLEKVGWTQFGKEALKRGALGGAGEVATETAQTGLELLGAEEARRTDTMAGLRHPETGEPITSTINDGDPWAEIRDTIVTTAQAMSLLGPASGAMRAGARFRIAKEQVDKTQEFYRSLGSDGIRTLAERAPDMAADHIRKRVKDSPFDHLQVDVRDLRRVLGELGMDDRQIVEMLPDAQRAFDLAAENPEMAIDVTVETGDFISEVVPRPDVYKALAAVVRAEGDYVSLEQMETEKQEVAEIQDELVKAAEKADVQLSKEDEALAESSQGEAAPETTKPVSEVEKTVSDVQIVSKKLRTMLSDAGIFGVELNDSVKTQRAMLFQQYSLEQAMRRNDEGAIEPVSFDQWFDEFGYQVLAQNGYAVDVGDAQSSQQIAGTTDDHVLSGVQRQDENGNPVPLRVSEIQTLEDIDPIIENHIARIRNQRADYPEGDSHAESLVSPLVKDLDALKRRRAELGGGDDDTLFQDGQPAPEFVSAASQEVDAVNMKSSTAKGWAQTMTGLVNKGKVKRAELDAIGFDDWLKLQDGKVSKEDVQAFIASNGVQVETVQLGEAANLPERNLAVAENKAAVDAFWLGVATRLGDPGMDRSEVDQGDLTAAEDSELDRLTDERIEIIRERDAARPSSPAKYGQYTLPGGENYREVLLTLPAKTVVADFITYEEWLGTQFMGDLPMGDAGRRAIYESDKRKAQAKAEAAANPAAFQSSHFDQKNIVASLRLNDRTDADGKRVLFVEEIQSDWAQEGRKKGFSESESQAARRRQLEIRKTALIAKQREVPHGTPERDAFIDEFLAVSGELQGRPGYGPIPAAPFVGKTDGWLNLALKKVMQIAVEGNYDRVAFINGEQSADRYDLSRQVDQITVMETDVGGDSRAVIEISKGRYEQIRLDYDASGTIYKANRPDMTGKRLDEVVGKEMADRILGTRERAVLKGEDLKIGGKGMIEFYDAIVPKALKKLLKKIGGKQTVAQFGRQAEQSNTETLADLERRRDAARDDSSEQDALNQQLNTEFERQTQESRPDEIGEQPAFDVNDAMTAKVNEGLPLFAEGDRGPKGFYRRTVTDSGMVQRVITRILPAADASTLLHESAHLFFDARIDLLRESLANTQKYVSPTVSADIETLFDIMEVGDPNDSIQSRVELWDSMTPDEIRPRHEAVARNFERYLMNAEQAPAPELSDTFGRISNWMTSIYGDAEAINEAYKAAETLRTGKPYTRDLFDLTPEVRQVFDRLFAAKQDVRSALSGVGQGLGSGFGDREDNDIEEAAAAAVGRKLISDAVRQGIINPKRIKSRVGADARRVRKAIAAQELTRASREPVHRLRKFLATGEFADETGEVIGEPSVDHRLNTDAVRAMAPGSLRDYGNVTSPGGLDPRNVAGTFGYESATEMLVDLRDQPRIKEAVRERTQKRMVAEFSELATPIAIQNTIKSAIAGEAAQAAIVDQINNVLGTKGNSNVTLQAARGAAQRRIRRMQLRELRTDRFEQSARRNRRLARERWADGDTEGAADAYRAELVDTATVREIARSRVTVENGERRLLDHFAASRDRARAKERDTRYLAVGRELLARVGLGPNPSKPGEATETLRRRDPEFYTSVSSYIAPIESFQTQKFRSLTWDQFQQVMDIGEMLWDRSKTQKFGELNGKRFSRNALTEELVDGLSKVGMLQDYQPGAVKGFFGEVSSLLTRIEHAMTRLDGGDRGVWWRTMYNPVRKAFDRATARQRKHLVRLRELLNKVDSLSVNAPAEIGAFASNGEFNHVFGKDAQAGQSVTHELVALLVNMGTQSNRDRVMLGREWSSRTGKDSNSPANIQPMQNFLRRMVGEGVLRQEHFDLAQGILDTYEEILPSFQAATMATQHVYANELEATPLVVTSGDKTLQMRGGYAPARYDETSNTKAKQEGKQAATDQGLFFGNSATKDRVAGFSDVVSLRLSDTMLAFQDHIRFAEVAPVAKQIRDLLEGGETREGESLGQILRKTNPGIWSDHTSALYVFLSRATTGRLASHVREPSRLSRFLRSMRNSFGLLQFSFDVKNAAENFSGLPQSAARIGWKNLTWGFMHQDGERASKDNDFMANRLSEDTQQVIATDIDPGDSTTALEKKIAYLLPRITQNIVDRSVWAGAHHKFMSDDRTPEMTDAQAHDLAVEYANSEVRLINSADLIDVGSYEGMFGEFGRLLTQWFSWANGQQQLTQTLWRKTMLEGGVGKYGRFSYRFAMQHWVAYMVAGVISTLSRDIPDDEDEINKALLEGLVMDPLKFTMHATAPVAGDAVMFGVSKALGERAFQAGSAPSISKVQTVVDDLVGVDSSTPKALADLAFLFRNFLPPKLRAAAALTGSAGRQIGYGSKVAAGSVEPTGTADAVRGAITGKASPESRRR